MRHFHPAFTEVPRSFTDEADERARRLANECEDFNRSYSTITTEQADDISRAINALKEALGRIGH